MPRFAELTHRTLLVAALSAFLLAACHKTTEDPCAGASPSVPSFRIAILAADGDVPGDLEIHVRTGGGEDVYDLRHPCRPDSVLVCYRETLGDLCDGQVDDARGDVGRDARATPFRSLTCNLWTDGTAEVVLTGHGQRSATTRLVPEQDACGDIKTLEAMITLDRAD
jgi:hypothetical protein